MPTGRKKHQLSYSTRADQDLLCQRMRISSCGTILSHTQSLKNSFFTAVLPSTSSSGWEHLVPSPKKRQIQATMRRSNNLRTTTHRPISPKLRSMQSVPTLKSRMSSIEKRRKSSLWTCCTPSSSAIRKSDTSREWTSLQVSSCSAWRRRKRFGRCVRSLKSISRSIISPASMECLWTRKCSIGWCRPGILSCRCTLMKLDSTRIFWLFHGWCKSLSTRYLLKLCLLFGISSFWRVSESCLELRWPFLISCRKIAWDSIDLTLFWCTYKNSSWTS